MNSKTKKITLLGMLCALAFGMTVLGHFIPIAFNDFLRYDPKDILIAIAAFALGPAYALAISVAVPLIEMLSGFSHTEYIGCIMNIISSAAFSVTAGIIYKRWKSMRGAVVGLTVSSLLTVIMMLLWNYIVTPLYMHVPREAVADMLLPVFLPFNIIKCGLNSAITIIVYKPLIKALRRAHLIDKSEGASAVSGTKRVLAVVISLFVIGALSALFIVLKQ